jgi:hypothetical protein
MRPIASEDIMSAITTILTSAPARFVPLAAASGIGIAPVTAEACALTASGRAAGLGGLQAEIIALAPVRIGARRPR